MAIQGVSTSKRLKLALEAGAILTGASPRHQKKSDAFVSILQDRLFQFDASLGSHSPLSQALLIENTSSELGGELSQIIYSLDQSLSERITAEMALWVVTQIHEITTDMENVPAEVHPKSKQESPTLGTRDLAYIRTLISIFVKWGLDVPLQQILRYWEANSPSVDSKRVHDSFQASSVVVVAEETQIANDLETLEKTLRCVTCLWLVPDQQAKTQARDGHITKIILTQYATSLLKAYIAMGWCGVKPSSAMQENARHLMELLPVAHTIASLGMAMASSPVLRGPCGSVLSQQLLRPGGVRGLFGAVFGELSVDDNAPLAKLEHVARVLSAVPADLSREEYYTLIIPRILAILSPSHNHNEAIATPPPETHKRAASFAISKMLTLRPQMTSDILSTYLRQPFYPSASEKQHSVTRALELLQSLLAYSDPSPLIPHHLLSPIIPPLYALFAKLDAIRTADPALKEQVRGLLRTWGGTVDTEEAIQGWWSVIQGGAGWGDRQDMEWQVTGGDVRVIPYRVHLPTVSLLPDDGIGNPLQLLPEPVHLVSLLKSIERKDVNSALLVRALDEYHALRNSGGADPLKTMLHLKLVMEMVEQLGSQALTQPQHVLSFIAYTIVPGSVESKNARQKTRANTQKGGLGLEDLRIVDADSDNEAEVDDEDDSDDEGSPEDMTETAINLLLAVLEANESLTPLNNPLLHVITSHLEPLTVHPSSTIRPLAREARLVLTARTASSSSASSVPTTSDSQKAAQDTYQQALKFLQDPILPVRAHGLLLLRQLVVPPTRSLTAGVTLRSINDTNPALIPAILDIFLQSVQEDDSYIYLNAVQGLVAMVDVLGKDILQGLMDIYAGRSLLAGSTFSTSEMSKPELDRRIRIGEALGQSIKKCGSNLVSYVDILIPPFFKIVHTTDIPTTLRTSALSLLSQCADTSARAILPWVADLAAGTVDLIQLEGVSARQSDIIRVSNPPQSPPAEAEDNEEDDESHKKGALTNPVVEEVMDKYPTSQDPKLAPFRRSALHFLSVLLRSLASQIHDSSATRNSGINFTLNSSRFNLNPSQARPDRLGVAEYLPLDLVRRMKIVLGYVGAHDVDGVVRVMAGEALSLLGELERAELGF